MQNAKRNRPLIVLGLDAGELSLVERWTSDNTLPNLARLRREGTWAPLDGIHDFNSFSVWPTFATGVGVGDHGYYSHLQLAPGTYDLVATDAPGTLKVPPWWSRLADRSKRCCIVDVPKIAPVPGVNGIQLLEWGAKSPAANPASDPPELMPAFLRRYGIHRGTLLDEDVAESPAYFEKLLRALLQSIRLRTAICVDLLRQERWDLLIHVFSETHSVGHRFMHFFASDTSRGQGHEKQALRDAMQTIYRAIDEAIGTIRSAAPAEAILVCCSMHGMGVNENSEASELLPELLRRYSGIQQTPGPTGVRRLASDLFMTTYGLTPVALRDVAKHHLSQGARKRLRLARMKRVHDQRRWPEMKAFSLPTDEGAFVRVNLKGREPRGRVAPRDYAGVMQELCELFASLYDPTTGKPAVADVQRAQERHPGPLVDALPDLIVQWAREPVRALACPRLGHIGSYHPHRSGTHRPHGFLMIQGPGIARHSTLQDGSVFDVAPTLLALLDEPVPDYMPGRPLYSAD